MTCRFLDPRIRCSTAVAHFLFQTHHAQQFPRTRRKPRDLPGFPEWFPWGSWPLHQSLQENKPREKVHFFTCNSRVLGVFRLHCGREQNGTVYVNRALNETRYRLFLPRGNPISRYDPSRMMIAELQKNGVAVLKFARKWYCDRPSPTGDCVNTRSGVETFPRWALTLHSTNKEYL